MNKVQLASLNVCHPEGMLEALPDQVSNPPLEIWYVWAGTQQKLHIIAINNSKTFFIYTFLLLFQVSGFKSSFKCRGKKSKVKKKRRQKYKILRTLGHIGNFLLIK
jgi:hypothetical protein